jgi:hypothetical protein
MTSFVATGLLVEHAVEPATGVAGDINLARVAMATVSVVSEKT